MTESTLAKTHKRQYKGPQAQWIRHCASHSIDPFNPKAVELLNFLADGIETKEWSSGTVSNYRSAILNLFPDSLSYWNNSTFRDFFRHLSSNAVKRFTDTPVDIAPVLDHFPAMGPNSDQLPASYCLSCAGFCLSTVSCGLPASIEWMSPTV